MKQKVLSAKKYKPNGEIEFRQVCFNSTIKTMINHKFSLENVFQEILYRTDNSITEGSGWIVELIESQYINVSTYSPLSGNSYIKLPVELKSPKNAIISIENNDQKCFLWCHVRHINPVKMHPERIIQNDKKYFPVREKDFSRIGKKNNICINVFCYENKLVFSTYVSDQKFENSMNLLLVIDENENHIMCKSKILTDLCFTKRKIKNKNTFVRVVCFSCKNVLTEHKKVCLSINGAQSVKLEK